MSEPVVDPVKRKCRYCGQRYVVPKWSKSTGCPTCAPRLFEPSSLGRPAG